MSKHIRALAGRAKGHIRGWLASRRFAKSIRASDVFIVAYPKSGTNWVGFFLASILDKKKPTTESLTLTNFRQYVPDVNPEYFARRPLNQYGYLQDPRLFTVHAPYDRKLRKVIYLVRDPRDVMVSYYFHYRRADPRFNMSLNEFVLKNNMWPGDWGCHVASWLRYAKSENIGLIRYEDLHRDGYYWFRNIAQFCGVEATEEELGNAMKASSFENMRLIEERFGLHGGDGDRSIRFIRRGRIGGWQEELSEELVEILEKRYGEIMTRLGYTNRSSRGREANDTSSSYIPNYAL